MKKTIVVGDIHGCFDELARLLDLIGPTADDHVIAVGDLTVKGPKSREVLDLFCSDERFFSVIGNHDLALVNHWRDGENSLKGVQKKAFKELSVGGSAYFEYLASLPYLIELESHLIVHAGLRPGIPPHEQDALDLTQLRTLGEDRTLREGTPWYEVYDGEKIALFGHWPAAIPRRGRRAIGLDTGCVYGYQLTAYVIETGEFFTTNAARVYSPPKSQ